MGSVRIGRTEIVSLINKAITLAHEQNGKTNAAWIALMILLHQRFRSSPGDYDFPLPYVAGLD